MGFLRQGELYKESVFGGLLGLEKQLIESKEDKEYEREHNGNLSIII